MFRIKVKDKLGTHLLRSDRDCCFKCKNCGKELKVIGVDKITNTIKVPRCPDCGGKMTFQYWLDNLYSEQEYAELLKIVKRKEVIKNEI